MKNIVDCISPVNISFTFGIPLLIHSPYRLFNTSCMVVFDWSFSSTWHGLLSGVIGLYIFEEIFFFIIHALIISRNSIKDYILFIHIHTRIKKNII